MGVTEAQAFQDKPARDRKGQTLDSSCEREIPKPLAIISRLTFVRFVRYYRVLSASLFDSTLP